MFSESEVKELMENMTNKNAGVEEVRPVNNAPILKRLLVVGCGDGGCNIASDIKKTYPDVKVIAYNTSRRGVDRLRVDRFMVPEAEDGSGKEREYSKNVFRNSNVYRSVLNTVLEYSKQVDYVIVTSTCDGGTGGGISPMLTSLLKKNLGVPVIAIGVYPALSEDARAQHNMLEWQKEIEDTEARYMVFDNERYSDLTKAQIHRKVNADIVDAIGILIGNDFGKTDIQAIDSRDMEMIINRYAGHIVIAKHNGRPRIGKGVSDIIMNTIDDNSQPAPMNVRSYGLFVKGDETFINNIDTSLLDVRDAYGEGDMFTHIQEANEFEIALLCAGCSTPEERVQKAAQRYKDLCAYRNAPDDVMGSIMAELGDAEESYARAARKDSVAEFDLSDLEL